jgi:hypothetical protein
MAEKRMIIRLSKDILQTVHPVEHIKLPAVNLGGPGTPGLDEVDDTKHFQLSHRNFDFCQQSCIHISGSSLQKFQRQQKRLYLSWLLGRNDHKCA